MAELKSFEVIMRLSPYAAQNKNEICFHAEKVTELVRCKNCKHWAMHSWCSRLAPFDKVYMGDDDFCSKGVRREVE